MTRFVLALAAVALVAPTVASARPDGGAPPTLQQLLDRRIAANPGTGIIVTVVKDGVATTLQAGTSGTARPLDAHTLFEIGSVTKTFTATALAVMAHDGRVALGDPVQKYLPAGVHVPAKDGHAITLELLATQHSGLPRLPSNLADVASDNPYARYTNADLYAFLNGYTLPRDPGATFEYSNLGVGLLGVALAHRAKLPYEDLIRTLVWKPLGMNETAIALSPDARARVAQGHDATGAPVHSWEFGALAGAGAIRSSAADMRRYLDCVMGHGPLGPICLSMQQPRATIPTGKIGLIWWIDAKTGIVEHAGDTAGFHAMVATTADHRTGVVVLANGGEPVAPIAYAALGVPLDIPPYETFDVPNSVLDGYAGTYAATDGSLRFTFARDGDHLSAQLTGQPAAPVFAVGPDHFVYHIVAASYRFLHAPDGRVVGVCLFQNGQTVLAARLDAAGKPVGTLPADGFPAVVPLDPAHADTFAGVYANKTQTFRITRDGGGLAAKLNDQPAVPIFPMGNDRFYYKIVDAELEFTHDAGGRVNGVILHQNGYVFPVAVRSE
jgi:CubicO group peptidase (beta-lactamase class C family)